MPMTSKEMISYLKKNGFEIISQNGSHVKMLNPKTNKRVREFSLNDKFEHSFDKRNRSFYRL